MKKKRLEKIPVGNFFLKLLMIVQICLFIGCLTTFSVQAAGSYSVKLSLEMKNASINDVLKKIEDQSEYRFFYSEDIDTHKTISVNFKNSDLIDILDEIFEGTPVVYKIVGRQIALYNNDDKISFLWMEQQLIQVKGKVLDSNGEPLPGVTVLVKGTTTGTATGTNGEYSLTDVPSDAVLQFSFIGMLTQEIPVSGQASIDVVMKEEEMALNEIIVIGYGTAKRKDYTGSVSSVKMENTVVSLLPNTNTLESLKGNVTGLNIGASNSAGAQPAMLIRGQNSINGSNDPLIVLDGVIYLGSINDINPNDIASVDVLKDAVSAAAYGSRAANGVIAITTKRGSTAKPVITFNTTSGLQTWYNRPVMMTGEDWIKTVNARNGYTEGSTYWMTNQEAANYADGKERVWLDDVTQVGLVEDLQLAVSGAGQGLNYYLSTAYNYNKGVIVGNDFNRLSILGKVNTDITSWLKIGVDVGYSRRDYSGVESNLEFAQKMSPYGVMYRDDENNLEKYPMTQSLRNPLWGVDDGTIDNKNIRENYRLNANAIVDVPWIKGLSYRVNLLYNINVTTLGNFYHENYFIAEGDATDASRYAASTIVNYLSSTYGNLETAKYDSYVWDNILNYKNSFGKNDVEVTMVATRDYLNVEDINSKGSDFSDNGNTILGTSGLQYATVQKIEQDAYKKTNIGYLGRLSYSYDNKYFLTGSFRRDGASVFGANKKWGNFAAFGLAWKITEENFMDNIKYLDNLKLKLSWGQNGNQGIDPYTTLSQVQSGSSGGYRYEFSDEEGTIYYGMVQSNLGNYDLGWESTESINAGFESAWLNNRLFVDVDAYFSKTTNQIFQRNIPVMTGFKTIYTSMGQVNNDGLEITVRSLNVDKNNLKWRSSVYFWKNWNKLAKLYGEDSNGDGKEDDDISNSLFIGKSLDAIYGYEQDGIVQEEDTEYMALTGADPGDPKYKDLDGVDGITSNDRKILGYKKENFRLSIDNTVSYKDLELYVLVSGIFGGNNYYLKSNTEAYMTAGTGRANDNMTYKPYWTAANRSNIYPSASFSGDDRYLGLQSRGFIRVQDITLSYTFHQQWTKSANINALKVYFAAKNIGTFTNWDGGDPETGAVYLANTYPVVTTYSLGATISF